MCFWRPEEFGQDSALSGPSPLHSEKHTTVSTSIPAVLQVERNALWEPLLHFPGEESIHEVLHEHLRCGIGVGAEGAGVQEDAVLVQNQVHWIRHLQELGGSEGNIEAPMGARIHNGKRNIQRDAGHRASRS